MHRKAVTSLLQAYQPYEDADRISRDETLAFVRATTDCFQRTSPGGHLTGSAWIIDPARSMVLLTHHRKLDLWLQLGGHADGNPDILCVAHREALEESGLHQIHLLSEQLFDVDVHHIPARAGEPCHKHYDLRFLFEANPERALKISSESRDLQWVEFEQLPTYATDESVLRLMRKTATVIVRRTTCTVPSAAISPQTAPDAQRSSSPTSA